MFIFCVNEILLVVSCLDDGYYIINKIEHRMV
jgi:hypothetical protein